MDKIIYPRIGTARPAVAAHRGNMTAADGSRIPENTMAAFESAYEIKADMIETDIRMTKDGQLVLIHDASLTRTTDRDGVVAELTLDEVRMADAGIKCGEAYKGQKVPTLVELLELSKRDDVMTFNFEFKDYFKSKTFDDPSNDFAKECADKIIAKVEEYGLADRCVINSFDGMLLRYIDEKYDHRYRLHGFYPYSIIGADASRPDSRPDTLFCACVFNVDVPGRVKPEGPLNPKEDLDALIAEGVEPWIGAGVREEVYVRRAVEYGAVLFTSNEPAKLMAMLDDICAVK